MDFSSSTILNDLLKVFQDASVTGMLALMPEAKVLLVLLGCIDIGTTWTLYSGEAKMNQMLARVIKIGAFLFLIIYWADINAAIMRSFQVAGLTAAGITVTGGVQDFISPSHLIDNGFTVVKNLMDGLSNVGMNFGKAIIYIISIGLVIFSFFVMSLQLLITKIEFNIWASVGVILMPFGAIRFTRFLFQRAVSATFAFGVKLMVMYFMLGMVDKIAGSVTEIPADAITFSVMLRYGLSYLVLGYLVWKIPNLAAGMVQGMPTMDAPVQSTGRAAVAAAGMPGRAVQGAAQTIGGFQATLAAARLRSNGLPPAMLERDENGNLKWNTANDTPLESAIRKVNDGKGSGHSVKSEFFRELGRQTWAGGPWGRGLIQGSNKSQYRTEDYASLKTGDYKDKRQRNRNPQNDSKD